MTVRELNIATGEKLEREYTPEEMLSIISAPEPTYADLRRYEYPPLVDFIDSLVKDDAKQIQAYKDACLAIKAKYPKP